jgi:sarcosine oxidase subunit alpha
LRRAGAGRRPAGLAAALAAAESGASVILADEQARIRRRAALRNRRAIDGQPGWHWAQATAEKLAAMPMSGCSPARRPSAITPRILSAWPSAPATISPIRATLPRERLWQVRARRVVIATGAIERHMVFDGNDRPGVMLASAARTYLNHYGVAVGKNVGVFTANDSAYGAAIDLKKPASTSRRSSILRDLPRRSAAEEARALGIEILPGRTVMLSTGGKLRVSSMTVRAKFRRRRAHHPDRRAVDVGRLDAVAASVLAVARQGRVRQRHAALPARRIRAGLRLRRRVQWRGDAGRYAEGRSCGRRARGKACRRFKVAQQNRRSTQPKAGPAAWSAPRPALARNPPAKAFVDFQNDVTAKDIRSAVIRACARSSTSSASPPTAWRPIRARRPTCTAWRSPPKCSARRCRRSASPPSARPIRPSRLAR